MFKESHGQVYFCRIAVSVLWLLFVSTVHVCSDPLWSAHCCISVAAGVTLSLGFASATFSGFVFDSESTLCDFSYSGAC